MKKTIIILLLFTISLCAQYPDGAVLLEKIDKNMASDSRMLVSSMVIRGTRGVRTIKSRSWVVGEDKSFTEYLAPAREKGTKMLKLDDNLWMYSPGTDRTIQISGHMLRQSVMGSDLSYEDMMEDKKLLSSYSAVVTGADTIGSRPCWIVELTAIESDIAYYMRKLWVDQEYYLPIKEELYAKSGKLLKKLDLSDIKRIEGRWFPGRMRFKDMLKDGDGTEFVIEEIDFNPEIKDYIFTKAALRK